MRLALFFESSYLWFVRLILSNMTTKVKVRSDGVKAVLRAAMTRPFAGEPQMFRFAQHDMVLLRKRL